MTIEELEEALEEVFPSGFSIDTDSHGQLVIFTGLKEDEEGELIEMKEDELDEDADSDFEPLEDEDEDDA